MRISSRRSGGLVGYVSLLAAALFLLGAQADPAAAQFSTLRSFCIAYNCGDGASPNAALVMDSKGNFFGTTSGGGVHGFGTVFEISPDPGRSIPWLYRVIYNFCGLEGCADGANPNGPLVVDAAGNLYGTTQTNSSDVFAAFGTAFKLSPPAKGEKEWSYRVLYNFCSRNNRCTDGSNPMAGLTYAGAASGALYDGVSVLYGTTSRGGQHFTGTIFTLQPTRKYKPSDPWKLRPIYAFCGRVPCANGSSPGPLLVGSAGTLYGPVANGGANNAGAIFELTYNSASDAWSYSLLYSFCALANCADGSSPSSNLLLDGSGNLVGTTSRGGNNVSPECPINSRSPALAGCGVVFRLAPKSSETVLYKFCSQTNCTDGFAPGGSLAMDNSGNLFGVTVDDGRYQTGSTLFELTGTSLSVLYDFCTQRRCRDGASPNSVITNGSGDIFGTTLGGGTQNNGTVFEWTP